jgi:hypothetical protein
MSEVTRKLEVVFDICFRSIEGFWISNPEPVIPSPGAELAKRTQLCRQIDHELLSQGVHCPKERLEAALPATLRRGD